MKALLIFLLLQYFSFASGVTSTAALRVLNLLPGTQVSVWVSSPTSSSVARNVNFKQASNYVYVPAGATLRAVAFDKDSAMNLGNSFSVGNEGYFTFVASAVKSQVLEDEMPFTVKGSARFKVVHLLDDGPVNITVGSETFERLSQGSFSAYRTLNSTVIDPYYVTSFIKVEGNGTDNSFYPLFPGRTFTIFFHGSLGGSSFSAGKTILTLQDSYAPKIGASETFENLCADLTCPPNWTCRNGRCLNVTEKCRDYSGFDVVEVARDVLIYVDGQIQAEINATVNKLHRLREAVDRYDPNTRRLNLIPYLKALDAFCGGRNCTDAACSNPASGCTTLECQYPNSATCPGLRQIEFLQAAFLGAIAVLNPGAACLASYTAL